VEQTNTLFLVMDFKIVPRMLSMVAK
jgi:hypothetical protein